jgi:hypothetical protein
MPLEFINPNWHVVLMHAPLGLLTIGVFIELFSFLWPASSVRPAARWMILLGALLMVPAGTLGLYAFRDVVTGGPINEHEPWNQVARSSPWNGEQWHFMQRHILFMSIATGLFLLGAVVWMGASDDGRRKLRWPVLVILLAGVGLMSAGARYSGEAVFVHGTAIERVSPPPGTAPSDETAPSPVAATATGESDRLSYYVSPLQLHLLLAGLAIALVVGALGVSLRRWSTQGTTPSAWQQAPPPAWQEPVIVRPPGGPQGTMVSPAAPANVVAAVYPARFWLLAFLVAAGTAVVGLWVANDWRLQEGLIGPLRDPSWRQESQRNFYHVIFGLSIVTLCLLVSLIARVTRRGKAITLFFALLLVLAAAGQVWLGILLLFDSSYGVVTRFNT